MSTTERSELEEEYVGAFADVLTTTEAARLATNRWVDVTHRLTAKEGPSVEVSFDLVDAAIDRSGLPEDTPSVSHALVRAARTIEAIANGLDPREAKLMAVLGLDPRKPLEDQDV